MHVHPAIAALRADKDLQRRAHDRMALAYDTWLSGEGEQELQAELLRFGEGVELRTLDQLNALLSNPDAASHFVRRHFQVFINALRHEPLGEVPLRQTSNAGFARLQLLERAGAVLSLCTFEPSDNPTAPNSAQFTDCEVHELVLAGEAEGQSHQLKGEGSRFTLDTRRHNWRRGDAINCRALRSTRQFLKVPETTLVLQLTRTPHKARPTLEFALPEGVFLRQLSGNKRASEQVMALAVLGALQCSDGLTQMVAFAKEITNDQDARWEAVRQVLGLDSERGLALLETLSEQVNDPISDPSRALLKQLLSTLSNLNDRAEGVSRCRR